MFMTPSDLPLLRSGGFRQSSYSDNIMYGTDKDGREWQAEIADKTIFFREVKNYKLGAPMQYSEAFFRQYHH